MSTAATECPPSSLVLRTETCGEALRVIAAGELEMATSSGLAAAIEAHAGEVSAIVLDLRRVRFIDSLGLRAILAGAQLCRSRGCALSLEGSTATRALLAVYGVLARLEFVEDAA